MACTRGSRGGELARSQALHCFSIARVTANPSVPASVGSRSGDQFAVVKGAASTRRAARKPLVTTVSSWPSAACRSEVGQLPFNLGGDVRGTDRSPLRPSASDCCLGRKQRPAPGHQPAVATGRFLVSRIIGLRRASNRKPAPARSPAEGGAYRRAAL